MNTPLTRIQSFEIVALCMILLICGFGVMLLEKMNGPDQAAAIVHGIETSWRSGTCGERVWSVTGTGEIGPWLDDHITAVKQAQQVLPIKEK